MLTLLVVTAILAGCGWGAWEAFRPGGLLRGEESVALEGAKVRRGDLRISIVERGNLSSADSSELRNETERSVTIVSIVAEGTWVEQGDLVCELDIAELTDDLFQREISVRNAEAAYVKSQQTYEIQKSQNESDIARAEQDLEFAKQDLEKFLQADRKLQIAQADEDVTIASEEYERAKADLTWSEKLHEKGFLQKTELDADRLALTRSEIGIEQKTRVKQTLIDYELPKTDAELRASLAEAERELVRVKLQATARIADYDADLRTNEAKLKLEQDKLAKVQRQIGAGKIFADRAGMVVYAKEDGGRWGRDDPIEKGTQVSPRQAIITIPKAGGMIAEASLHESVLKQVHAGLPCWITVDALPSRQFHGSVKSVAMLPDQNSWYANPNQRLYKTQIEVANASEELRPGMSCSVEILVEDIPDAIHVPVQAVFKDGGEHVVFISSRGGLDKRSVTVGAYNDRWVQVLEGLEEGETVAMAAPAGFAPKSAPQAELESMPGGVEPQDAGSGAGAARGGGGPGSSARADPESGGSGGRERSGKPSSGSRGDGQGQQPSSGEGTRRAESTGRKQESSSSAGELPAEQDAARVAEDSAPVPQQAEAGQAVEATRPAQGSKQ